MARLVRRALAPLITQPLTPVTRRGLPAVTVTDADAEDVEPEPLASGERGLREPLAPIEPTPTVRGAASEPLAPIETGLREPIDVPITETHAAEPRATERGEPTVQTQAQARGRRTVTRPEPCPRVVPPRCRPGQRLQAIRDERGCVIEYRCEPPFEPDDTCPTVDPPNCAEDERADPVYGEGELSGCVVGWDCVPIDTGGDGNGGGNGGNGGEFPPIDGGGDQVIIVNPEEINCDEYPPDEQAFCWERYGSIIEAQRRRREEIVREAVEHSTAIGSGVNLGVPVVLGALAYAVLPGFRKMVNAKVRKVFGG